MPGWWKRWLRRRWGESVVTVRGRYERFQHLITGNNRVLELIADAGEKTGGDYLFDHRYLEWLTDELEKAVESVVYDLNAMTGGRHLDLVDAFERIRYRVRAAFSPNTLTASGLVIPLDQVDLDLSEAVGGKMASIGELFIKLGLRVPNGFVVTASACRRQFLVCGLGRLVADQTEELKKAGGNGVEKVAARLQQAIRTAPIDGDVSRAIEEEVGRPDRAAWMYAVRSSAMGEDGRHSFAGQHLTLLNVRSEDAVDAYREVLASLFSSEAIRYRLDRKIPLDDSLMAVGFLIMVPARAAGVLHTVDPAAPQKDCMVVSAAYGLGPTAVQGLDPVDRYELSRDAQPRVLHREIARKKRALRPRDGGGTELVSLAESDQSMPCVTDDQLVELARTALLIERHAGHHQEIEWAVDEEGLIFILQARALRVTAFEVRDHEDLTRILSRQPVLLRGRGMIACRGVGAGPVVVIRADEDIHDFPLGGVLVAQSTSVRFSPLLARASAVITEVGSSTEHLATVARELRVPMLVDVRQATRILRTGTEVTVDAEENVVYKGVIPELVHYHLSSQRTEAEFEEFRLLGRLLRRIAPLNLTDPEAETFRARSCGTYHDVVRFAHEMAVRELIEMPGLTAEDRKRSVRRLKLEIPMDLELLDLGGGITPGGEEVLIHPDRVQSQPLAALLEGLCAPGAWRTEPVDMDLTSFLASATRTTSFGVADTSPVRPNLAVVSKDYMNLHLLLGYHFNMVDCHLSDAPGANYVYFRFTGGVTDITRRSRRARVIAAILEEHGFAVEGQGDLVIGRLRNSEPEQMRRKLAMIGRLIGFTRQLDVLMRDEDTVRERTREFVGYQPITVDVAQAEQPKPGYEKRQGGRDE